MIEYVKFNGESYRHDGENDLFIPQSKNTIIICTNPDIKNKIVKVFLNICYGKCETKGENIPDYSTSNNEKPSCSLGVDYLQTTRLWVDDEQLLTLTTEAPFVYAAKDPDDIWFAALGMDGLITIYPMTIFKGYKKKWDEGIDAVYAFICDGRYGAYERIINKIRF